MEKRPCVYIMASSRNGTLYLGVTANLYERVWTHRNDVLDGFTKRYGIHRLVYHEHLPLMEDAISREKQLKKWSRAWKIRLIEEMNPEWLDLFDDNEGVASFGPGTRDELHRE